MAHAPRCFISYAWDRKAHENWIVKLATALVANGVKVSLDLWDIQPGSDLPKYMETTIGRSHHVLLICTAKYAQRANDRVGGVGWETSVVTGQMFEGTKPKRKFCPILRKGNPRQAIPSFLKGRLYIDFRGRRFNEPLEQLLRHIYKSPRHKRPALGPPPSFAQLAVGGGGNGAPPKTTQSLSAIDRRIVAEQQRLRRLQRALPPSARLSKKWIESFARLERLRRVRPRRRRKPFGG